MPVSDKQLAANRKNAKRSTGPKTESGKTIASRNSTTHGAFAHDLIIRSPYLNEDPAEYDRLLASLTNELKPETLFQECLVCKIANTLWRSKRIVAAETAHILKGFCNLPLEIRHYDSTDVVIAQLSGTEVPEPTDEERNERYAVLAAINSVPNRETTRHLLYYEMRLDRQLTRAYRLLKELKRSSQPATTETLTESTPAQLPANPESAKLERDPSIDLPKTNPILSCPQ